MSEREREVGELGALCAGSVSFFVFLIWFTFFGFVYALSRFVPCCVWLWCVIELIVAG